MTQQMKMSTTDSGKSSTKTISDVNPYVTNPIIRQFGTKLVALTKNTYVKTQRVITYNVDTDSSYTPPTPPSEEG